MKTVKLLLMLVVLVTLTSCDAIGKRMASKTFKEMQQTISTQEVEIAALQQKLAILESQLSETSQSEHEQIDRDENRKRNLRSLFSREN